MRYTSSQSRFGPCKTFFFTNSLFFCQVSERKKRGESSSVGPMDRSQTGGRKQAYWLSPLTFFSLLNPCRWKILPFRKALEITLESILKRNKINKRRVSHFDGSNYCGEIYLNGTFHDIILVVPCSPEEREPKCIWVGSLTLSLFRSSLFLSLGQHQSQHIDAHSSRLRSSSKTFSTFLSIFFLIPFF